MRSEIKKGIDAKKSLDAITAGLEMAWYKEWTGKAAKVVKDNVKFVFEELTGKINHSRLGIGAAPLDLRAREMATVPTATLRGPSDD